MILPLPPHIALKAAIAHVFGYGLGPAFATGTAAFFALPALPIIAAAAVVVIILDEMSDNSQSGTLRVVSTKTTPPPEPAPSK